MYRPGIAVGHAGFNPVSAGALRKAVGGRIGQRFTAWIIRQPSTGEQLPALDEPDQCGIDIFGGDDGKLLVAEVLHPEGQTAKGGVNEIVLADETVHYTS